VLRFTITVYRRPIFIIKGTIQVSGIMLFLDNENPFLQIKIWSICVVWEELSGRVTSDMSLPSSSDRSSFRAFDLLPVD
jgi:hypothetical protein